MATGREMPKQSPAVAVVGQQTDGPYGRSSSFYSPVMTSPAFVLGVLWAQFGPYHFARVAALTSLMEPGKVYAIEFANQTSDYNWRRTSPTVPLITLCPDSISERLSFLEVFLRARKKLTALGIKVCLLPSYSPKQSLAALLAAKSLGVRTIMMNETHAGTARATGLAALVKRRLIGLFDAALVGGTPQKRYFAAMGLPEEKIFTGYDAVDNDYFITRAEGLRSRQADVRAEYGLPAHYFLSLGRFVPKKNLETLIRAYRQYLDVSPRKETHLVMVGSGEEEARLRSLCRELNIPVCDNSARGSVRSPESTVRTPRVHFYGFRQIEENPVFYALADAFILPSRWEEWGLVVNEAMASGLPVAVSETAGCAEDLLEAGSPAAASAESLQQIEHLRLLPRLRRNGFVFSPDSSEELSRALIIFESSAGLRAAMGAESRRIVDRFSTENFARSALRAVEAANGSKNTKLQVS